MSKEEYKKLKTEYDELVKKHQELIVKHALEHSRRIEIECAENILKKMKKHIVENERKYYVSTFGWVELTEDEYELLRGLKNE